MPEWSIEPASGDGFLPAGDESYSWFFLHDAVADEYPENPDLYVRAFTVVINGKRRRIITYRADSNGERLREFHRRFAEAVGRRYRPAGNSYAYKPGSCVLDALREHRESDVFLKTDIHAYFDSVDYDRLEDKLTGLFAPNGLLPEEWTRALWTCFYDGHLPIGFISSPVLSDLYLHELDLEYAKIPDVIYSRYADDLILSGGGAEAEEKLEEIRGRLETDMEQLGLELNRKKTYIRRLKQPGDAIHLLGLNMVKREGGINDITVSDRYIREVSRELCALIAEKPFLDDMEAVRRFTAVMGKISYIQNASPRSAEKLRKMVRVKSGVDTDLAYKSLVKLCVGRPEKIGERSAAKRKESAERHYPAVRFLRKADVWIRFSSAPRSPVPADLVSDLPHYLNIKRKVMRLCRNAGSSGGTEKLRYLRLTIGGETRTWTGEEGQAEEMIRFCRRISRCPEPFSLFLAYSNDGWNGRWLREDRNIIHTPYGRIRKKLNVSGAVIAFDEERRKWEFRRETSSDGYIRYNSGLLKETEGRFFRKHPEWEGELYFSLWWPLRTEAELDARIRKCAGEYKELAGGGIAHTDGIRSVSSAGTLRCSGKTAERLTETIRELASLAARAGGEPEGSAWFIPAGFREAGNEMPFDYIGVTVWESGRTEVRGCSL